MAGLADKYSRLAALRPARPGLTKPATLRAPNREDFLSHLLGAGIATNHYGEHVCVRNWFSSPEFTAPLEPTLELLSRSRNEILSKRMRTALADPEKWLFLDTETTGLAGGTGTYAFLVGLAWWDAGGLQVEQLFLRDFTEEHSILHEVAARLAERPVLVTFNGKTFDWPLLENRFTMTRSIPVPRLAAHLDLVHPARALWRPRLGSVRLVDLERYVLDPARLGWHRDDDVASSLIPQQYFDYLRGGPVEPLVAILRHNQMDLRGLAALFGKINALVADESQNEDAESLDLFGLSRFLQRRGDPQRAHSTCAQAIALGLPFDVDRQARCTLARLAKSRGNHHDAAVLWNGLTHDEKNGVLACEQLAIYYERRKRDFVRALEFAQLALAKEQRKQSLVMNLRDVKGGSRRAGRLATRVARLKLRVAGQALKSATLPLGPRGTPATTNGRTIDGPRS